jgi:hypothetical protein
MAGFLPDPTPPGAMPTPLSPIPKPPIGTMPAPAASAPVIPPQVGRTPIKKAGKPPGSKKASLAGKLKGMGK